MGKDKRGTLSGNALLGPTASSAYTVGFIPEELSMNRVNHLFPRLAACGLLSLSAAFAGATYANASEKTFVSHTREIDGVKRCLSKGGNQTSRRLGEARWLLWR